MGNKNSTIEDVENYEFANHEELDKYIDELLSNEKCELPIIQEHYIKLMLRLIELSKNERENIIKKFDERDRYIIRATITTMIVYINDN